MALKPTTYAAPRKRDELARVGGRKHCAEALSSSSGETLFGADLGTSSKYSNENFEGQSGERFLVNSNWTRVRRSQAIRQSSDQGAIFVPSGKRGEGQHSLPCSRGQTATPTDWDTGVIAPGRVFFSIQQHNILGNGVMWRQGFVVGRAPHTQWCPVRGWPALKILTGDPFSSSRTHNRIRSPRFEASDRRANVDKGSRHNGSVTLGQRLALRVGYMRPLLEAVGCRGSARASVVRVEPCVTPWMASAILYNKQLTQNWYKQGEPDCLIKTKHCDGFYKMLTRCDFCPVLFCRAEVIRSSASQRREQL
eukprot:TRINITY_DN34_c0_g1_i1.p1 TRINITY_DN34_c0_g1~~TRINITY_DN34_c0_g1_i1.p1  ORF type:complete len:308 (-),score=21.34 TRINITY_DN34_c0_g1_i1:1142-2065(-)